jgi:hypothetical protein
MMRRREDIEAGEEHGTGGRGMAAEQAGGAVFQGQSVMDRQVAAQQTAPAQPVGKPEPPHPETAKVP